MQPEPIKGSQVELKFQGCGDLPVRVGGHLGAPMLTSAWRPSPEELAALNDGACVELTVLGEAHPPVSLIVMNEAEYQPCECTLIEQEPTCPVGYPSLLCEVCDGRGIVARQTERKDDEQV